MHNLSIPYTADLLVTSGKAPQKLEDELRFLLAAKSVLRFETASQDQRAGEYVIVGTLASFGWAMVAGWAIMSLLSALPPIGFLPENP